MSIGDPGELRANWFKMLFPASIIVTPEFLGFKAGAVPPSPTTASLKPVFSRSRSSSAKNLGVRSFTQVCFHHDLEVCADLITVFRKRSGQGDLRLPSRFLSNVSVIFAVVIM